MVPVLWISFEPINSNKLYKIKMMDCNSIGSSLSAIDPNR